MRKGFLTADFPPGRAESEWREWLLARQPVRISAVTDRRYDAAIEVNRRYFFDDKIGNQFLEARIAAQRVQDGSKYLIGTGLDTSG